MRGWREGRGWGNGGMQDKGVAKRTVKCGMNEHGGGRHRMTPRQPLALHIDHDDVVGLHLAPEPAPWVDQKARVVVGQGHTEVVAHALGQAMVGGCAQRERKILAQLNHGRAVKPLRFVGRGSKQR